MASSDSNQVHQEQDTPIPPPQAPEEAKAEAEAQDDLAKNPLTEPQPLVKEENDAVAEAIEESPVADKKES
jgi:hypothetical protein